jgi:hypothetical protein
MPESSRWSWSDQIVSDEPWLTAGWTSARRCRFWQWSLLNLTGRVLGVDIRASRFDPMLSSVMINQRVRWSCQREITSAASSVFYWKVISTEKCSLNCEVITYSSMTACLFHKGKFALRMLKINVVIIGTWTGLVARASFMKNASTFCIVPSFI